MQKYKITATGETVPENEIQAHFKNVSFVFPLGQDVLDHFGLELVAPTAGDIANALASAKTAKNLEINAWRAQANQTSFTHAGKQIACDALSRSDIDAVAGSVALSGAFPAGFPNAWKATDNTYLSLPDVAAFKAMYASMTLQGTINFGHSQTLKASLAAATTIEQVNAIAWA